MSNRATTVQRGRLDLALHLRDDPGCPRPTLVDGVVDAPMPSLSLDSDYKAAYVPYQMPSGFIGKGAVFFRDRPVRIFDVRGATVTELAVRAKAKAEAIHTRLRERKRKRTPRRRDVAEGAALH